MNTNQGWTYVSHAEGSTLTITTGTVDDLIRAMTEMWGTSETDRRLAAHTITDTATAVERLNEGGLNPSAVDDDDWAPKPQQTDSAALPCPLGKQREIVEYRAKSGPHAGETRKTAFCCKGRDVPFSEKCTPIDVETGNPWWGNKAA